MSYTIQEPHIVNFPDFELEFAYSYEWERNRLVNDIYIRDDRLDYREHLEHRSNTELEQLIKRIDRIKLSVNEIAHMRVGGIKRTSKREFVIREQRRKLNSMRLEERFRYEGDTGQIIEIADNRTVGNVCPHRGYIVLSHAGQTWLAHRVAWYLHEGVFPECSVYHRNGDLADNRWSNLTLRRDGAKKRYQARVKVDGKRISLGCFPSREEARRAEQFYRSVVLQ